MLLTEFRPQSDTSQSRLLGRLALKVRCQTGEFEIDLVAERMTIGSSPRCDICIQQFDVQPLHCLIVCSKGELSVRRWAAGALLNDQPFEEAPLAVGDHISLGTVDLEVVEEAGEDRAIDMVRGFQENSSSPADEPRDEPMRRTFGAEDASRNGVHSSLESDAASWEKGTVHHTTVWIGEDEGNHAPRSTEKEQEALEPQVDFAVESPPEGIVAGHVEPSDAMTAEVVPAEPAREVFRQLQEANANSRSRSRKLLDTLRTSRGEARALSDQVIGLTNTKDELVAEKTAMARERNLLREQLATAEQRYAEWDHRSNQWEDRHKEWEVVRSNWDNERAEWERERTEWTRQVGGWEARLAGHLARIEELEAQLAEAQAAGQKQSVSMTAPSPLPPVGIDRANDSVYHPESAADATNDSSHDLAVLPTPETSEAPVPTRQPASPTESPAWERHTPSWESDPPSWEEHHDHHQDTDPELPEELPEKPETDSLSSSGQPDTPLSSAAVAVAPPATIRDETEEDPTSVGARRQPTSFLGRFAHLLRDDEASGLSHDSPAAPPAGAGDFDGKPQNGRAVRRDDGSAQPASADEESIEEYMAKLMQRVRGEQPHVAASQSSSSRPTERRPKPAAALASESTSTVVVTTLDGVSDGNSSEAGISEPMTDLSEMVRSAPAEQPTNLEALRALANESARRAIGVHTSKQKRRDAVTKFIVASFAGITSVWLMMLAPTWRDLQFIAACVALLIAAYWAGQAYAALVEMHRAGEYDGPKDQKKVDHSQPQQAVRIASKPSPHVRRAHGG